MALRLSAQDYAALQGGNNSRTPGTKGRGRYPVAAKAARTYKDIVFDSKGEMERYCHLEMAQRAGLIHGLKRQVGYAVTIGGQPFCAIRFDFEYWNIGKDTCDLITEEYKSAGTIREKDYHLRRKAAELFYGFTVKEYVAR